MKGWLKAIGLALDGRERRRRQERERRWLEQTAAIEDEFSPCTGLPYVEKCMWLVYQWDDLLSVQEADLYLVEHGTPMFWKRVGCTEREDPTYQEGYDVFPEERDAVREMLRRSLNRCILADEVAERTRQWHHQRVDQYKGRL